MFDTGSLRKLKAPAIVALALLLVVAGYYLLLAIKRTTYLTTSNIRLLTTIGHQFDDWVRRQEEIFRIVIRTTIPRHDKGVEVVPNWRFVEQPRPGARPLPWNSNLPPCSWTPPAKCLWS